MAGKGLAARKLAHAVALRVLRESRTIEQALASQQSELAALTPQDRAFVYTLAMALLRWHGACEALLAGYLKTPLKASRLDITLCLHLGICQLLVLKTPPHAAVDATVELAKQCHAPLAGLVNAVLKKIATQMPALDATRNLPDWLWQSWVNAYGEEKATAMAAIHAEEPPLDITVKKPQERELWAERLHAVVLPQGSLRLPAGGSHDVKTLPGFAEGAWWVQEVAATLPAKLLGDVAGKEVLDLCAAPGGKTMQLAAADARVTALDSSATRLKRLHENLQRTGLEAEIVEADLLTWRPEKKFDAILLDAPCSATGTIRRHPEIPWLRKAGDIKRLAKTQAEMVACARNWLKPGGALVYAVCSLQPEEGEAHGFLGEAIRTLPCDDGGMDGFYMVKISG